MKPLLIHLRAMNLFSHSCHNLVDGIAFHEDHAFFASSYEAADDEYDSVAERTIGIKGEAELSLAPIAAGAAIKLKGAPSVGVKENSLFYQHLLQMEQELCMLIQAEIQLGASEGTRQMLGNICDASEMRQYKIKQRLK
jgi:DNA-binding ferritin-like protein